MLRGFFSDALDRQLGRCEHGFRSYLKEASRAVWRQRTWVIGAFATGMAASVAALWAGPLFWSAGPRSNSPSAHVSEANTGSSLAKLPAIERVVQSHVTDEGVMMLGDDTPVRVLHRQRLEQTRWLNDRQQIHEEQGAPQDEMVFIKMPTY